MKRRVRTLLFGLAVALTLAAVFAAYLQPNTVVQLANQVWSCL